MVSCMTSENALNLITERLKTSANLKLVVLFGSYAKNSAHACSDIDLIIVENDPYLSGLARRERITSLYRLLADIPYPKDILCYSKDDWDRYSLNKNHVAGRAFREGVVLYLKSA